MKVMLTSFGLGQNYFRGLTQIEPTSAFQAFHAFPPLDMDFSAGRLGPKYSLLVLCDKLILDIASFEQLTQHPSELYKTTSRAVKILQDAGFLELIDYSTILHENRRLLSRMTANDLMSVDQWFGALGQSSNIWLDFLKVIEPFFGQGPFLGKTHADYPHVDLDNVKVHPRDGRYQFLLSYLYHWRELG